MSFPTLFENRRVWDATACLKMYLKKLAEGRRRGKSFRSNSACFQELCQLMAMAVRVVKTSFVSAGRSISFFPVAAAPAVPAPAPAAAPIAAPLPPPASAPIIAPPAAPPPMNPASRLPLPPSARPAELVDKVYVFPPTVTVRSRKYSFAGVDKRPEACTLLTVNFAAEPLGITTLPPDATSCKTVPVTVCPILAVLELTAWSITTEIFVPSGTVPPACARAGHSSATARKMETRRIRVFISVTSGMD